MIEEQWWAAAAEHRLTVQRCLDCGHLQHYPRALCTGCGGLNLEFTQVSGRGTVDSFTVVQRAPGPDFDAPYTIARVRLAEGPILLSHLVGPGPWTCDEPVRVAWNGRLPVFEKDS